VNESRSGGRDDSRSADEVVEVGQGSAGEAQELDEQAAARRSEQLGTRPKHLLDERQEKIRDTRRRGGPDLQAETEARAEAVEAVPNVEPTETEEDSGAPV
jgi:hypothetical protein